MDALMRAWFNARVGSNDALSVTADRVHVYPLSGRAHSLDGWACWCEPEPDPVEPAVVIHHAEH